MYPLVSLYFHPPPLHSVYYIWIIVTGPSPTLSWNNSPSSIMQLLSLFPTPSFSHSPYNYCICAIMTVSSTLISRNTNPLCVCFTTPNLHNYCIWASVTGPALLMSRKNGPSCPGRKVLGITLYTPPEILSSWSTQ